MPARSRRRSQQEEEAIDDALDDALDFACCCRRGRRKVYDEDAAAARVQAINAARGTVRDRRRSEREKKFDRLQPLSQRRSSSTEDARRSSDPASPPARRGSLANQNKAPVRRASLSDAPGRRRSGVGGGGGVLHTNRVQRGPGSAGRRNSSASRRRSGAGKPVPAKSSGAKKVRHRRHSVESRSPLSPLSPVVESPVGMRGGERGLPLATVTSGVLGTQSLRLRLRLRLRLWLRLRLVTERRSVCSLLFAPRSGVGADNIAAASVLSEQGLDGVHSPLRHLLDPPADGWFGDGVYTRTGGAACQLSLPHLT